jgi:SAM-dependent methyltransferase
MNNLVQSKTIYSKLIFSIYDKILLNIVMPLIWHCNKNEIIEFYSKHLSHNHLDIGAGTGYFIKHTNKLNSNSNLTIMDINPVCLSLCEQHLVKYTPNIIRHNILDPIKITKLFDSIGLNLLLHCLPGDLLSKGLVFQNIKNVLKQNGIVFGSTFIVKDRQVNIITKLWFILFNRIKLLSNEFDNINDLSYILKNNFKKYDIKVIGHCAFFWGQGLN